MHDSKVLASILAVAALAVSGCAEVSPWQRGTLARRCMQLSPTPELEAAREHVLSVREAAAGGHGAQGGGCGCN